MAAASSSVLDSVRFAGAAALTDAELLAVVSGAPIGVVEEQQLVDELGGLGRLPFVSVDELAAATGLAATRALRVVAAVELGRRSIRRPLVRGMRVDSPRVVVDGIGADLLALEDEELHVLGLDARGRLLVRFVAGRGGANLVYVAPRDVFRRLVREGAAGAILVHNHPSGEAEPSAADRELTARLAEAGRLLGIALLDHVIVARSGAWSFADQGEGRELGAG